MKFYHYLREYRSEGRRILFRCKRCNNWVYVSALEEHEIKSIEDGLSLRTIQIDKETFNSLKTGVCKKCRMN